MVNHKCFPYASIRINTNAEENCFFEAWQEQVALHQHPWLNQTFEALAVVFYKRAINAMAALKPQTILIHLWRPCGIASECCVFLANNLRCNSNKREDVCTEQTNKRLNKQVFFM